MYTHYNKYVQFQKNVLEEQNINLTMYYALIIETYANFRMWETILCVFDWYFSLHGCSKLKILGQAYKKWDFPVVRLNYFALHTHKAAKGPLGSHFRSCNISGRFGEICVCVCALGRRSENVDGIGDLGFKRASIAASLDRSRGEFTMVPTCIVIFHS